MLLGLDFDNTLIRYDALFHQVALERAWIPADTPRDKVAVRDYLRSVGREDDWTLLQGIVYGTRILDAEPFEGMLDTLGDQDRRIVAALGAGPSDICQGFAKKRTAVHGRVRRTLAGPVLSFACRIRD